MTRSGVPTAHLGGMRARGLLEVTDDLDALDRGGRWAVSLPYSGRPVLARFSDWAPAAAESVAGPWCGPSAWRSSQGEAEYVDAVQVIRERIAAGDVYQANACRVMSAEMPDPHRSDIGGLHALLCAGNPAPYAGMISIPGVIEVASASPELFVSVDGDTIESGPIKGTGRTSADLTVKDEAENVMIVDLVRNDLSRVCLPGTVSVPSLLAVEQHPGLVHLVSRVRGRLGAGVGWKEIAAATFPPGSVTGAPKIAALAIIDEVESAPREIYCGALGWVDADQRTAELAVAIRTFWLRDGILRFGTGAGITWGSDPVREWQETELKAARLTALAGGQWPPTTTRPGQDDVCHASAQRKGGDAS